MNCKKCGKEIESKLENLRIDTITIKNSTKEEEKYRLSFLNSIHKDLDEIIREKNEELLTTCSYTCSNKMLYEEYLNRLKNKNYHDNFYKDKLFYTQKKLENYK